ncbi:hypothetical protein BX661DRAFT_208840 [Kickxella alabastrina]|uniref:uncharacterized protein n=1 Tax=Kickxella alabastrina TaxID=61397 RepID=UPI002220E10D|nr:uncharacterized protein BX661DRAFT_208840 [Kickxella alabastrina]KAI7834539.1 hypothetical protein BX661DRAFT_208840 [Kickxella alabastrina]
MLDTYFTRFLGNWFSTMFKGLLGDDKEVQILIIGLEFVGNTTMLYRLQVGKLVSTIPTIGAILETISYKNIKFKTCNFCSQPKFNLICDRNIIGMSKDELGTDDLKDAVLLVFANKKAREGAMDVAGVAEALRLPNLKNRHALKSEGLYRGLDWLANTIQAK